MLFDPSALGNLDRYRNMSVVTLTGTIMVGESLLEAMPEPPPELMPDGLPESVKKAASYLKSAIDEANKGMTDRFDGKVDTTLERAFDVLVDRVWAVLRARLEFWHCYNMAGIALLDEAEQAEAEVEKNRKLATIAKDLLLRLFGQGVYFLRLPYPQQAAHMAARLRYIESRGLEGEFKEIVGPAPVILAKVCQRRYEAMVKVRSARDTAVNVNFKPLRAKVAWAAENYAAALIGTLPEGNAEWAKAVLAALHPMVASESRGGGASDEPEQLPKTVEEIEQMLGVDLPAEQGEAAELVEAVEQN